MQAKIAIVTDAHAGQRIDNFLITQLKGVPKARIYRAIRSGEVRINSGRIRQTYRIQLGDKVRIPPISAQAAAPKFQTSNSVKFIEDSIIFEDKNIIVVNKPANLPVHGGTGVSGGLIERVKMLRPECKYLNLAHRLDRATSGCIVIAKKRSALLKIQEQLTNRTARKQYLCLVKGNWTGSTKSVKLPLKKNQPASGERHVIVHDAGKASLTIFEPIQKFTDATLLVAFPKTGRTHQIRVHAAASGFPIAGDEKYGDVAFNKLMSNLGLRRMFLHSAGISFTSLDEQTFGICAPLPRDLKLFLKALESYQD